jgi:tetratricopeptide (TPR) repeat protein
VLRRIFPAILLAIALTAPALAKKDPSKKVLTPPEIIKLMEKSSLVYTVSSLESLKDLPTAEFGSKLWPTKATPLHLPTISKSENGVRLTEYPESGEETEAIEAADEFFKNKKYDEAETSYLDVVKRFPSSYRGHLFLGDVYFFRGNNERALWAYREAARLDPYQVLAPIFEAHALAKLGRSAPALDALVRALSLQAYHETSMKLAVSAASQLGIEPHPERFEPKAFVRRNEKGVDIYIDTGAPAAHWFAWASCKAVWMAEPSLRPPAGENSPLWSSQEDRTCLVNLLVMYKDQLDAGKVAHEAYLDRAWDLVDKGLIEELVIYEFGTRISPDSLIMLTAEDPDLDIPRFVREFVIPEKKPAQATP